MDKVNNALVHDISINERKNIIISGLKKIESFDSEEFLIETVMGFIMIKGEELEIIKLDTYQGNVTIKGKLNTLNYIDELNQKEKETGVINRLFK
ncbi:MAG: sporulation protein YabP [Bacilli bacterium]|jgi:sporulation protein YabP|nr:sporulation protein YabP [Bacilli bacterium]